MRCADVIPSILVAALLLTLPCVPAFAAVDDLAGFLRSVEATAASSPLLGDGRIEVVTPSLTRDAGLMVLFRPPADLYLETRDPACKVLVLQGGDRAYRFHPGLSAAEPMRLDAAYLDSDFTREDLEPFRTADYKGWRIADEDATEITVTLFPKTGQYSQLVTTFDIGRKVALKTLYYKDTLSNLVKMQRDSDFTQVGGTWMPTTMTMQTFTVRTHTTLKVRWMVDAAVPAGLFDPAQLAHTSPLAWPTPGVTAAGM